METCNDALRNFVVEFWGILIWENFEVDFWGRIIWGILTITQMVEYMWIKNQLFTDFSKSTVSPMVVTLIKCQSTWCSLAGLSISPITEKMTIKSAESMPVDELITLQFMQVQNSALLGIIAQSLVSWQKPPKISMKCSIKFSVSCLR